jgi:hypothetical protein
LFSDAVILKAIVACVIAGSLLIASLAYYRRHVSGGTAALVAAMVCFLAVAVVHVCEATRTLSAAGWGQPASVGHYIDLGLAILGIVLLCFAVATMWIQRLSN